jgi:hypothetical protein
MRHGAVAVAAGARAAAAAAGREAAAEAKVSHLGGARQGGGAGWGGVSWPRAGAVRWKRRPRAPLLGPPPLPRAPHLCHKAGPAHSGGLQHDVAAAQVLGSRRGAGASCWRRRGERSAAPCWNPRSGTDPAPGSRKAPAPRHSPRQHPQATHPVDDAGCVQVRHRAGDLERRPGGAPQVGRAGGGAGLRAEPALDDAVLGWWCGRSLRGAAGMR